MHDLDRFYSKTAVEGDCIVWIAGRSPSGYGKFSVKRKHYRAHRWIYEQQFGEIPADKQIDHTCNNRACVNLAHLRVATAWENTHAPHSTTPARLNSEKTHCPQGHELADWNVPTALLERGERGCKSCNLARSRNRYRGRPEGWWRSEADRLFAEYQKAVA